MRKDYVYNVGDVVVTKSGCLEILEQIKMKYKDGYNRKAYVYRCKKCNNEDKMIESSLLKRCGCNVCGQISKKVLKGVNDIATTSKNMLPYFIDIKDACKYSNNSNERLDFKCPECGCIKNMKINNLYTKGFRCPRCGDGKSFPEKFMFNVLYQLGLEFNMEKTFDWSKKKKYDFYIPHFNLIIETHGLQHYEEVSRGKSLKEEQENDRLKELLAKENGINNYIVVDCRYSEANFIKNNILISKLNSIFDLKNINWNECLEYSYKSLVKTACDIFNQGIINTTHIAKLMNMERSAIYKYLQIGNKIGWCVYDRDKIVSELNSIKGKSLASKVICLDNNMIFDSCLDLQDKSIEIFGIYLRKQSISRVCKGTRKHYKGFHFEFLKNNK